MSRKYMKAQKMKMVERMQVIALKSENDLHRRDASEVVQFFIRNGFLPGAMLSRCSELVALNGSLFPKAEAKPGKVDRHYLYAIQCGDRVKVGYSVSPRKRLRRMQTGNAEKMVLVWRVFAADDSREAKYQEKKLHRYLRKYRIRGEWFDAECIPKVKSWRVKNREAKEDKRGELMQAKLDAEVAAILG